MPFIFAPSILGGRRHKSATMWLH